MEHSAKTRAAFDRSAAEFVAVKKPAKKTKAAKKSRACDGMKGR
jgi:hypothetical protein